MDAACAKFGFPLYRTLREEHAHAHLRVWRVSHFGGHVFAPTLIDLPTGHLWAYIGEAQAAPLASRVPVTWARCAGVPGLVGGCLPVSSRPPSASSGNATAGPGSTSKDGRIVAESAADETPRWAEVQIDFEPDGRDAGAWRLRVEVSRTVETEPSTDSEKAYPYPQYLVTGQERLE